MKRTEPGKAKGDASPDLQPTAKSNGPSTAVAELEHADLSVILASLQTMRDGDFSARLPGELDWIGGQSRRHARSFQTRRSTAWGWLGCESV